MWRIKESDGRSSRKQRQKPKRLKIFQRKSTGMLSSHLGQVWWIALLFFFNKIIIFSWFPACSIPDILQEIAKEDEEKKNRHLRRMVAKEERLKSGPPRLGKRKYLLFYSTQHFDFMCVFPLLSGQTDHSQNVPGSVANRKWPFDINLT